MNTKRAVTDYPILSILADRWSPYGFEDRPVSEADLRSLFEAARWAASSYNEQPWNYLVATRENSPEFGRLLSCLVEANQAWAKEAAGSGLGDCQFALFQEQPGQSCRRSRSGLGRRESIFGGNHPQTFCSSDDRHPPGQGEGGLPDTAAFRGVESHGHRI